jgi:2-haloacid dehalogenase
MTVSLTSFDVLVFDCYGTLIDWETGILRALWPWRRRQPVDPPADVLLEIFARAEAAEEAAHPSLPYPQILERVFERVTTEVGVSGLPGEAAEFGRSVGDWPPFDDAPAALAELRDRYRLVVLSNVDRASFHASNVHLGAVFDDVLTAEEIGSYKPDPRNFEALLANLRLLHQDPRRTLHVAQSLFHDHVPAKRVGLATCWIDRRASRGGWGATPPPQESVQPDLRFTSLAELATAVRTAWRRET